MNCEYCKQENMTTIARRNEICPVCEENARRVRELEGEVERLKEALADAIRAPMGVCPDSAAGLLTNEQLSAAEQRRAGK